MTKYSVRYVHRISPSEKDVAPDVELSDTAFSDAKKLGKAMRDAGILAPGGRVRLFRVEGSRVVVFPVLPGFTTYWHAIVLES